MFGDPNSLSGKTVSTVPFLWYFYPTVRQRWIKILIAIQVVFAINIIVFTASRTGYLAFLASTLLIIMYSNRKKMRLILLLSVAAVIAVNFVPAEYKERFMSSFTGQEAEGQSSATRKALFFDSLKTFAEHPLGVGLHNFANYQAMNGRNAQETHNLYTQILAETGIQGFVCFVALVSLLLRKALRARKAFAQIIARLESHLAKSSGAQRESLGGELRDTRLLFAAASALIVFTFTRLILGVFGHDFLEIYWWFAAGVAMALHNMRAIAEQRCAELTTAAQI
jgi:O-antigen ligase